MLIFIYFIYLFNQEIIQNLLKTTCTVVTTIITNIL